MEPKDHQRPDRPLQTVEKGSRKTMAEAAFPLKTPLPPR